MIETIALAAMLHHSVAPGDTLSAIAQSHGVSVTQLEQANPQISDPNLIFPGQVVNVPSFGGSAPPLPSGAAPVATGSSNGDGDNDGDDSGSSTTAPPESSPAPAAAVAPSGDHEPDGDGDESSGSVQQSSGGSSSTQSPSSLSGSGGNFSGSGTSSFEQCVIQRESGGNAQAVNSSSGAGGLFQFLPSTWAGLGFSGLPQNASVATQQQAFNQAVAQFGTQPWTPSDGCH